MSYYDDCTEYDEHDAQVEEFKNSLKNGVFEWIRTSFSNVKVGDKIVIYFFPDSQKYINELFPKFGEVTSIDPEVPQHKHLHDIYTIERINLTTNGSDGSATTTNAAHPWCSYYGNTRGYCYDIYKLTEVIDLTNDDSVDNQEYGNQEYGNQEYGNQEYGDQEYGNQEYGNQQYDNQEYDSYMSDNDYYDETGYDSYS